MSDNYVIPMLEKAFEVLELISNTHEELSLSEISQKLDIPKTTVFRIMTTLQKWGYVEKSLEQETFRLGKILIKMGKQAASDLDIKEISLPYLDELAKETGESANLGILYQEEVLTLANAKGEDFYLISRLIPTSPLNCSSMGKLYLAEYSMEELEEYFRSSKPQKRTIHSITNLEEFLKLREEIKKEGLSYDREEYEYGLTCMAAPIRDKNGNLVASMSISGPTSRLLHKGEDQLKEKLLKASSSLSKVYNEVFRD